VGTEIAAGARKIATEVMTTRMIVPAQKRRRVRGMRMRARRARGKVAARTGASAAMTKMRPGD
jgi:hypothetical protein